MQLSTILSAKGTAVVTIAPQAAVRELVQSLAEHRVGALVVSADGSHIDGIVSERDVVRALARDADALSLAVSSIMTAQVHSAAPTALVDELMVLMTDKRIRHVPVTDDSDALVGIVSIGDIVKSRLGELEDERAALLDYIRS